MLPPRMPVQTSSAQTISFRALAGYGVAAAPVQFMSVLVLLMYMKYAVDSLGASASVVGIVFLAAKLWDAISDPAVGHMSDRTTHRLGRRRVWIFASVPLLCGFGQSSALHMDVNSFSSDWLCVANVHATLASCYGFNSFTQRCAALAPHATLLVP